MKIFKLLLSIVLLFMGTVGFAQQFSYKPLNPAFGGDTFNYNWLLSSATSQNKLTAPANERDQRSELQQFGDNLNRQLLSQISRQLLQQQLGGLNFNEEGTFTYGSLNVEIFQSDEGLVINILDTSTGEETQVIVPN
ncbi:curli production assembly/transport component CsgF [Aequorivita vladivostokensis]|uniref:Curli production assembly/transport component CsgF n=1 Tax=Aequorivita vladivostokensis TaxID=171194 RepID=A0ABR5DHR7_9FLAO|nr:curli production assembly/transport component CsgF [Aequorivita vladivostokensis]KJJ38287.1 curli assembly protein CsgF [Aequorivita vladivostokensis]MAB57743.1 curli assembly protein CsgF [Aequorivita sp.]MBF29740.1 curli assembly protein CsgF [Aequorivita sp.]|tara:strand:- start:71716 stop:72126 length:411 start_codon:yes stop_codon:yes gene_type:complete